MRKILAAILLIVFFIGGGVTFAQKFDYTKNYIIKLPDLDREIAENFETQIVSFPVQLSKINDKSFMLTPPSGKTYDRWMKSVDEPEVKAWLMEIESDDVIKIIGMMGQGEGMLTFELIGSYTTSGAIKGNGTITPGLGIQKMPYFYKIEWALVPEDFKEKLEISNQLVYDGPSAPAPSWPEMTTKEEEAKRPFQSDRSIKRFASHSEKERERFYNRLKGSHKAFYDNLLSEFPWDEMRYAPGILLLIDHLASLEKGDQKRIADAYVRDGSVDFFGDTPYEEIQKVPPLYLILRCLDKMNEEDIQGLIESSPRFQIMMQAYESSSPGELTDLSLLEFVIAISKNLPADFRKEYLQQSQKLRDYVHGSGNSALRSIYPFGN